MGEWLAAAGGGDSPFDPGPNGRAIIFRNERKALPYMNTSEHKSKTTAATCVSLARIGNGSMRKSRDVSV